MRVHDVLVGPRERDQREPGALRQAHREGRRRRQRDQERDPDGGALLHHLVAGAAGDEHITGREIRLRARQRPDGLVQGIVPAHVLAHHFDPLSRNHPRRRVHAAGARVDRLPRRQLLDGRVQIGGAGAHPRRHRAALADGIRGALRPAQAAAGATGEVAATLQELCEALPGDRDVHVRGGVPVADLHAADLLCDQVSGARQRAARPALDREFRAHGSRRLRIRHRFRAHRSGFRQRLDQAGARARLRCRAGCGRARSAWARFCQASFWLTSTTSTAVTLYSGQLVAQSEFSVVTTFALVSGKWNVVYTTPGAILSLTLARRIVSPARLVNPTQSPCLIPRTSASCGWISNTSSACQITFCVRRVCAPTLYWLNIRPVVSISGNRLVERSVVGTYSVTRNLPLPRTNW